MIRFLLPDYRFKKITDISADFFSGAKLVILDVDNTLTFSSKTETKKEILEWLSKIKDRHECILISNRRSIIKMKSKIENMFGVRLFVSKRRKPSRKLFLQIQKEYGIKESDIFVIGDRLFTDVLFANLNGATSVLVDPISAKENFFIKLVRYPEKFLLFSINALGYNK